MTMRIGMLDAASSTIGARMSRYKVMEVGLCKVLYPTIRHGAPGTGNIEAFGMAIPAWYLLPYVLPNPETLSLMAQVRLYSYPKLNYK